MDKLFSSTKNRLYTKAVDATLRMYERYVLP